MNYSQIANIRSLNDKFIPPVIYYNNFLTEHDVVFQSVVQYRNIKEFIDLIENWLIHREQKYNKKTYYKFLDKNQSVFIPEIIFINNTSRELYSITISGYDALSESYPNVEILKEEIDEERESISDGKGYILIEVYCQNQSEELIKNFLNENLTSDQKRKKKKREINIVVKNDYGFCLLGFPTNKCHVSIDENYNDDFLDIHNIIVKNLSEKESTGLILLSGVPGSGKTFYIRYLTSLPIEKNIIYIPPDMSSILSDPDFLPFMLQQKDSILLIEDAENILKTRKAGGNQSISNILNLADGILGDCLKIQIICTFNCSYDQIDNALKRPGRLIAEYKFDKLSIQKTNYLLHKLYPNENIISNQELTLSEVYNYKNKTNYNIKETTIGFKK